MVGKQRTVHPHEHRIEFWSDLADGIRPIDSPDPGGSPLDSLKPNRAFATTG